jgi:hypothetical protein
MPVAQRACGRFEPVTPARHQDQAAPFSGKQVGNAAPNTLGGARDHYLAPGQSKIHVCS